MTAFLFSQAIPDTFITDVSVNSNTPEIKNSATPTSPITVDELRLAAEVLQIAEIKNTANATMFLSQTISQQYKKISEDLDSTRAPKKRARKKTMKELMQRSFFHGANWMGSNFIA